MQMIYAPQKVENFNKTIFLAGSIDMNKAVNWQSQLADNLKDTDFVLLNPRRLDWDSSWENTNDNPMFVEQVNWELDCLEKAERIIFYFAPNSLAPISLLELGLFADSKKLLVCCSEDFWRKGNVDVICKRFNIPQVGDLEELTKILLEF